MRVPPARHARQRPRPMAANAWITDILELSDCRLRAVTLKPLVGAGRRGPGPASIRLALAGRNEDWRFTDLRSSKPSQCRRCWPRLRQPRDRTLRHIPNCRILLWALPAPAAWHRCVCGFDGRHDPLAGPTLPSRADQASAAKRLQQALGHTLCPLGREQHWPVEFNPGQR